jgi:hypothetical protein
VIWILYRTGNERIFFKVLVGIEDIVKRVKSLSWKWVLAMKQNSPYLLYEWRVDPSYIGR